YEVPNVPNDPTNDTPINYVPAPQPKPTPSPTPKPEPKTEPKPETPQPVSPSDNGYINVNNNETPTTRSQQAAHST
nr:hypothetical protein [Streptococcus vestibularis]